MIKQPIVNQAPKELKITPKATEQAKGEFSVPVIVNQEAKDYHSNLPQVEDVKKIARQVNESEGGASYTKAEIDNLLLAKENTSNKTTTLNVESTNDQFPSAKVVYDNLVLKGDKATTITDSTSTTYDNSLTSNIDYIFTQSLTALTITSFVVASGDNEPFWSINFKTDSSSFTGNFPDTIKWTGGTPTFATNKQYTLVFKKGITDTEILGAVIEF